LLLRLSFGFIRTRAGICGVMTATASLVGRGFTCGSAGGRPRVWRVCPQHQPRNDVIWGG
jgi:hypothetical protein